MDLLRRVMSTYKLDESKAERGIGTVLMALRMALDHDTFDQVRKAIRGADSMMGRSLMSGGRTGELAMMAGPGALLASLSAAGFSKEDAPQLVRLVLEHLRPTIGAANIERFYEQAPTLKG